MPLLGKALENTTDMPDWIEPLSKEDAKKSKQLPIILLRWRTTTVPVTPLLLPVSAQLRVSAEGIQMHLEDDSEFGSGEADMFLGKDSLISVEAILMPPFDDGMDMRFAEIDCYSRAVIKHEDPYGVVPYFESIFTSDNDYWLRALAKSVKETLGIKSSLKEIKRRSS